jgi:hypothetical protein
MAESLPFIFKILWLLFQWFMADKVNRALRAKEIAALFKKMQKEGDNLAAQLHEEMSRTSSAEWDDIKIRAEDIDRKP